jgi:hypothetical protein
MSSPGSGLSVESYTHLDTAPKPWLSRRRPTGCGISSWLSVSTHRQKFPKYHYARGRFSKPLTHAVTPFITGAIDFRYGYVFAGTNVLGGLIVYFFVIEGQGRTLEEIDTMYLLGVKPWESAKWVVPSLEEMSGKMRERLEAGNPELTTKKEIAPGGVDGGVNGARAEEQDHVARDDSEEGLREKEKTEV